MCHSAFTFFGILRWRDLKSALAPANLIVCSAQSDLNLHYQTAKPNALKQALKFSLAIRIFRSIPSLNNAPAYSGIPPFNQHPSHTPRTSTPSREPKA
jgi:hypothetical protein